MNAPPVILGFSIGGNAFPVNQTARAGIGHLVQMVGAVVTVVERQAITGQIFCVQAAIAVVALAGGIGCAANGGASTPGATQEIATLLLKVYQLTKWEGIFILIPFRGDDN